MQTQSINTPTPLIIFDMDETLIAKDLSVLWHHYLVHELNIAAADFLEQDKHHMQRYYQGAMDMDEYIAFSLAPLRHYTVDQIDQFAAQFVASHAAQYIYPEALDLIKHLHKQGKACMIISATISLLVKAMAKHLNIEFAEGVNLEISDNYYTGKISGTPSYQKGKVIRLQQWLESQQGRYEATHFYSDSINDLPLLLEVPNPVVINGCQKLTLEAQKRNWTQEKWSL
ncbi:HAD family hydrolase [Vibrio sp. WXL210]|uniref:HAD family hydrolase n=1 Tax=Vibrio sp. WXL210 TaxID=3450709 RepID=UPI003EC71EF4